MESKKIVSIETDVRDGKKYVKVRYDDGTKMEYIRPLF